MSKDTKAIYSSGKASGAKDKASCPYGHIRMKQRSWWLAGWHDYQIENGTGIK